MEKQSDRTPTHAEAKAPSAFPPLTEEERRRLSAAYQCVMDSLRNASSIACRLGQQFEGTQGFGLLENLGAEIGQFMQDAPSIKAVQKARRPTEDENLQAAPKNMKR